MPKKPESEFRVSPQAQKHHRAALRARIGLDGDRLWAAMMDLAEGKPYRPMLPDGTFGEPIVPSPDVRLRALMDLADRGFGKAVAATELVKAEQQSSELFSIQALSDAELEAELKRLDRFTPGNTLNAGPTVDAEFQEVTDDSDAGSDAGG